MYLMIVETGKDAATGRAALPTALERLLTRWVAELKAQFGILLRAVCLYGSVARGDHTPASDIDLLVVLSSVPAGCRDRTDEIVAVHRRIWETCEFDEARDSRVPHSGNVVAYTEPELRAHPPLLLDITQDGRILYDPDGVLLAELNVLREGMRKLGSKRVFLPDGKWYWILKPDIKFGEMFDL